MATANPTAGRGAAPPAPSGRWAPLLAAIALTGAFAFLAFRLSFAALTALAAEHGVAPDVAWMFAFLVDGGAVVGTVGVVMARRTGRRAWPYWTTVVGFAAVSLAFNVAHSDGSTVGIAIAVTPPAAQLVATELLVRMLPADDGAASVAAGAPSVDAAQAAARHARAVVTDAERIVSAAVHDATAAATDAAERAEAAAERFTQVSRGDSVAGVPVKQVDLAALVAAVEDEPPHTDADADALPPKPSPLSATFTAAPSLTGTAESDTAADTTADTVEVPQAWLDTYRRIERTNRKRPTAERLGAELGLKRTRGSEIRAAVEAALEQPCDVG